MALVDNAWYVNSVTYGTVTAWAAATVYTAGSVRIQLATPAVNSERCFVCIVAGTSHATTEPTWVTTRGGKTTDNTVTWQECTGVAAINGDLTNTPSWTITATPPGGVKNTAVDLGQVIKRDNAASYQICTTAGTCGNGAEPAFSDTAGVTTTDNTVTWTSLGVVGGFTGWQYPHARLKNAVTTNWGVAGNNFYLASEHAETQATANVITVPGTVTTYTKYLCVTKTTVPPATGNMTTGASITTTGASNLQITGGSSFFNGITFNAGTGANAQQLLMGSTTNYWYTNCVFNKVCTGNESIIFNNGYTGTATLVNCSFSLGHIYDNVQFFTESSWTNSPIGVSGLTLASGLFSSWSGGSKLTVDGVDLSALDFIMNATDTGKTIIKNCKLKTGVTALSQPVSTPAGFLKIINSDSAATNYRHENYSYYGAQTAETTIIRTGGATNGTTPIAWKIITTSNSTVSQPFEATQMASWNNTVADIRTVTVYGIWGGGAVPTNADIWIEVNFMGSSATPISSFKSSGLANVLATGTNLTTDTSTWGGSTTKFKMSVTLDYPGPNMKGPIYVTVKAAKASSTFYIDPKPVIT